MKIWAFAGILTGLVVASLAVKRCITKPAPVEKEPSREESKYCIDELIMSQDN